MKQLGGTARQTALRAAGMVALCLCLQACPQAPEKTEPAPLHSGVAKGMHRNALMDAAFGAAQQKVLPQEVFWQTSLPLPPLQIVGRTTDADNTVIGSKAPPQEQFDNTRDVLVRPREVVKINETQLALVIESLPQSAISQMLAGAAPAASGTASAPSSPSSPSAAASVTTSSSSITTQPVPVWLGVIFFSRSLADEHEDKAKPGLEAWRATRVIPFFDAMLLEPHPPETQVYKLGSDHYLMTYMQHGCRQGTCSHWLTGYLLRPDGMTEAIKTRLSGSNVQAWADCHTRLQPYRRMASAGDTAILAVRHSGAGAGRQKQAAPATMPAMPAHSCYAIHGEMHPISREMAVADVSIRFEGVISENPAQRRTLTQTQLWRLQGDKLVQIEGEDNPVPSPDLLP